MSKSTHPKSAFGGTSFMLETLSEIPPPRLGYPKNPLKLAALKTYSPKSLVIFFLAEVAI